MSESKLQVAFINWMRASLPDVTVFHVYNETGRNSHDADSEKWGAIQGKIKKDRGVLAGVHDNIILWEGRNFATIELKDPNKPQSANKYSPKQQEFAEILDKYGFRHACCQTGAQIDAYIRSLGLKPQFPFPRSLDATMRQMTQFRVADALYGM